MFFMPIKPTNFDTPQSTKANALDPNAIKSVAADSDENEKSLTTKPVVDVAVIEGAVIDGKDEFNDNTDVCQLDGFPVRGASPLKTYGGFALVSIVNVVIGLGIGLGFGGSPESLPEPIAQPEKPQPKYVAAVGRCNEPIPTLVPLLDLDLNIVELGRRLFHDPGLSGNGRISCATCHNIEKGGVDGLAQAIGSNGEKSSLNTATVLNAAFNYVQSYDGRAASLEEHVDGPMNSPTQMGSTWERTTKYVSSNPAYIRDFKSLLGGEPTAKRISTAIATYERSLVTPNSKFDQWLSGDEQALSSDEFGGYYLFKKFSCYACHQGAGVGGTLFQLMGAKQPYFTDNDLAPEHLGRFNVTGLDRDRHVFRVPQLRSVALTGPYLHDGSVDSLEETVAIMLEYQCGQEVNQEDVRRITAFLKTLSGVVPK